MYRPLALIIAIALTVALAAAQSPSPCRPPALPTGAPGQNIFTEAQEADLGDAIAEHLQRNFRVIDDEEVTGYLNRVGQRIIKHLPESRLRFQFMLVDLSDANAFVLPGGRIYVSRKLVALAESEDELGGVIGHEIGHLLARQGAIMMTRLLREVLGVTEVKDRRDIFAKYNQFMENLARKPKAAGKADGHEEKDQVVADQLGLFATASAGYDPQGLGRFFDRLTENKGKTGSFFSDLFGTTKPESKRLREMIKGVATLPSACVEARAATTVDEFRKWQAAVVNYTGLGRRESLHAVIKKIPLEPPLRSEVNHLRFSPDGRYVLAQDDSGINVLSREPFAPLFRIEAPEAKPAQFSPDSQDILVYNSSLRVEIWQVAEQKLKTAHELFIRKGRLQTALSPDGKILACLDTALNLDLYEVASGTLVFQKKSFYLPDMLGVILLRLLLSIENDEQPETDIEWITMQFSPDSRYFAAGARSLAYGPAGSLITESNVLAFDLTTREQVPLRGALNKKLLANRFTFIAPDRLMVVDASNVSNSPLVSFPAGEVLERFPLGRIDIAAPSRGNYLLVRPISNYPVGVFDLATKKIILANKQTALDIYNKEFVAERLNGELGLYGLEKQEVRGLVRLPRNRLGRLRAAVLSPDMQWLAVSERTRGAVWNLTKNERFYHVRGFRGGYFAEDAALYADFPKFEQTERTIARLDLTRRDVTPGAAVEEARVTQHGPIVILTKPAKKTGGYQENVVLEARDVRRDSVLWSKAFPKEAPRLLSDGQGQSLVLAWAVDADAAQAEIKADPALARQLATLQEKEGDYFLQALDAHTGKPLGRLLIETGKGSFRITNAFVASEWLVITDSLNRVLVYGLANGEQKGKVFGSRATVSPSSKLLCVENERGQLTLYDLAAMEKRDQFSFSSPVSLVRFSTDGKSLFVLTANQTVYLLDMSPLLR